MKKLDDRFIESAIVTNHVANVSDPHNVTQAQVGLSNVDNTSDATKNSASVTLTNKTITSPSGITLADLSSDSTHRIVTDAEKSTWNGKSDLVLGTSSTQAYRADRALIAYNHSNNAHAPSGAEVNVQSDWNAASGDAHILNKPSGGDALPAGSKLYFYSNTAPSGWVIDGSVLDKVLSVRGGNYGATGGNMVGTWALPEHTLILAEIPNHEHGYNQVQIGGDSGLNSGGESGPVAATTGTAGGGGSHSHGSSQWRPWAAVGIIATKS